MPKYSSSELYDEVIEAAEELVKEKRAFNLTQLAKKVNEIRKRKGIDVEVKISSVSNVMKRLQRLGIARREGNLWTIVPSEEILAQPRAGEELRGRMALLRPRETEARAVPMPSPVRRGYLPSPPVLPSPELRGEDLGQRLHEIERRLDYLESSVRKINEFNRRLVDRLETIFSDVGKRLEKLEKSVST